MEFKKLEINQEGNRLKRTISSEHFKKTVLYGIIGAVAGYVLFYFEQNVDLREFWNEEALRNMLMGSGFGIFLRVSPCSRGRC